MADDAGDTRETRVLPSDERRAALAEVFQDAQRLLNEAMSRIPVFRSPEHAELVHIRQLLETESEPPPDESQGEDSIPPLPNHRVDGWPAVFDWDKRYGRLLGITSDKELALKLGLSHSYVRRMRGRYGEPRRTVDDDEPGPPE